MKRKKKVPKEVFCCKVFMSEEDLYDEFQNYIDGLANDRALNVLKSLIVWKHDNRYCGSISEKVVRGLHEHLTKVVKKWNENDRKGKSDDYI